MFFKNITVWTYCPVSDQAKLMGEKVYMTTF